MFSYYCTNFTELVCQYVLSDCLHGAYNGCVFFVCSFITSKKEIIQLAQLVSLMSTATLSALHM